MENNTRKQMQYQKTEFNSHLICHLQGIFKCCKCKKNNTTIPNQGSSQQNCIFCGTPNYVKGNDLQNKNKL
jgi:hypothetical protein